MTTFTILLTKEQLIKVLKSRGLSIHKFPDKKFAVYIALPNQSYIKIQWSGKNPYGQQLYKYQDNYHVTN